MKGYASWATVFLTVVILTGCAAGKGQTRYIELGDMLPCEMISLTDGTRLICEVEFTSSLQRGGIMTAMNPVTNESFKGEYRVTMSGGGSSTAVVTDQWGFASGTVKTKSDFTSAVARGFFKGDKGTVIDVSMDLLPVKNNSDGYSFQFFSGQGTATDNHDNRYQIYFGY